MSIQAQRERAADLAKQARNLHERNGETWNADSQKEFDGIMDQIDGVKSNITREEKLLALGSENAFKDAGGREIDTKNVRKTAYATLLRSGENALSAEQRASIQNTMSTTTGSEGGFTVQTEVAKSVVSALKAYGGMRSCSQIISTAQGNAMSYPTTNGTAEVGELIAENTTATSADPVFGATSLLTYKYSSKIITVPFELLQDSEVDVESLVNGRLAERLGRITNTHYTTGTGTGQPNGVVTAAGVGKTGLSGQTTSIIYDDLVDLQHSVDAQYRLNGKCKFMMNDLSLRNIRKVKDSAGRPLFVPGYDSAVAGAPDFLMGNEIVINNDVAVMAANAKSVLFGDFNYYIIRDVMGLTLFRFTDSAYAKLGQVGFLAWFRSGGNFIDASGGAVKHYANSAT